MAFCERRGAGDEPKFLAIAEAWGIYSSKGKGQTERIDIERG